MISQKQYDRTAVTEFYSDFFDFYLPLLLLTKQREGLRICFSSFRKFNIIQIKFNII